MTAVSSIRLSARSPPSSIRRRGDAADAALQPPIASQPSGAGRRWTISSKILRPSATVSSRSFDLTNRRILARALPVTTIAQPGRLRMLRLRDEDLDLVAIVERVRSGITRPLILAPTVWSPRSVWTA
jgi:hypothetical protein